VTASARLADANAAGIAPGSEYSAIVAITIADGWHIYGNPTGIPELKPTTLLLLPLPDSHTTLLKVSYPIGADQILGRLALSESRCTRGRSISRFA